MEYDDFTQTTQQHQQQAQQQQQQQQSQQHSPQRQWNQQMLTPPQPPPGFGPPSNQQSQFYYHQQPGLGQQQMPPDSRPATGQLSLNMSSLSMASPTSLSPINPQQQQQGQFHGHHAHSHSQSSGTLSLSPITPVSPPSFSGPHLSPQPSFHFNPPDDSSPQQQGGLDPSSSRRLNAASPSHSEYPTEKSVPRKRSFTTNTTPSVSVPSLHPSQNMSSPSHTPPFRDGHAHAMPHPIITTTASSPPPSARQSPTQIDINAHPPSPYDETDPSGGYNLLNPQGDESDDDTKSKAGSSSGAVMGKPMGTNNFVTKLYQMINDSKSQQFISWTEMGASFVVSNVGEFSRNILGSHFKHNNFSSFVRQLNMYGFHKINRTPRAQRTSSSSQTWEFSHPKFLRERPDLLDSIKRKALEPDPRERGRVELPGEVARMISEVKEDNRSLWKEVGRLGGRVPKSMSLSDDWDGDDEGEGAEWDSISQAPNSPGGINGGQGLSLSSYRGGNFMGTGSDNDWRRWVDGEMRRERRKVERLVGVVRVLCDSLIKANVGFPPDLMQDILEIDTDRPLSPHAESVCSDNHNLNIHITSPPSPSPSAVGFVGGFNPHITMPTLTISQNQSAYSMHTPSSSPTGSDFPPHFFGHSGQGQHQSGNGQNGGGPGHGHSRSLSNTHLQQLTSPVTPALSRQPSITFTASSAMSKTDSAISSTASPTTNPMPFGFHAHQHGQTVVSLGPGSAGGPGAEEGGPEPGGPESEHGREKRQRMGSLHQDDGSGMQLEIEDLQMARGPGGGNGVDSGGAGGAKKGLRARSDSAPMWANPNGGLSANWGSGLSRPRSGSNLSGR